jgi:hypothetical protein
MGNAQVSMGDRLADALQLNFHQDGETMSAQESAQKRLNVCGEILSTEKTYAEQLGVLYGAFELPMRHEGIGSSCDLDILFGDVQTLFGLHRDFYVKLEERLAPALNKGGYYTLIVGDLFSLYSSFFSLYSNFIDSYERRLDVLASIVGSKKFGKAFKELEQSVKVKSGLRLDAMLIVPVQRLPRYLLLLNSLLAATLEEHKDHQLLREACVKMQGLCEQINTRKKESENAATLMALQEKCSDNLALPSRKLISERAVQIVRGKKKVKPGVLLVCTDALVLLGTHSLQHKSHIVFVAPHPAAIEWGEHVQVATTKKPYSLIVEDAEQLRKEVETLV